MGRKPKHSLEVKLKAVEDCLSGKKSRPHLANELSVIPKTIRKWVKLYEAYGSEAFMEKPRNKAYSKTIKEAAVQAYLSGQASFENIAFKYGLTSESILINWVKKYNRHEELEDYNPKGDVYMKQGRKTTLDERLEIVKYCIEKNEDYKGTAALYDVSYAQVYQWVKQYRQYGEEGLFDRRGKARVESKLSEVEKLERKVKQLERELELKEKENIVLKKLKEVERRRYSPAQNKKRNT
jgi:transposase-like protein